MVFRTVGVAALVCLQAMHPRGARAQAVSVYAMYCINLTQLSNTDMAPRLVRSVRDCIDRGRYEEAVQLFFAYSVYSTYDAERVLPERQNDAVINLNNWMFADYPRAFMVQVRLNADKLRDRESMVFAETCAALLFAGPPTYLPYYLVGRGIENEVASDDWQVAGFEVQPSWQRVLAVNGCPVG